MSARLGRRQFLGLAGGAAALALGCDGKKPGGSSPPGSSAAVPTVPAASPSPSATACPAPAPGGGAAGAAKSVARVWDEAILAAIRVDTPRPPVHARNLYHFAAAMWDAWAAYDPRAVQVFHRERASAVDVPVARAAAISFAAYRLIRHRYAKSFGAEGTLQELDTLFAKLGYDAGDESTSGNTPAALGNRIFATVRDLALADGANEAGNYAATNGYRPINQPLVIDEGTTVLADPNRWQPLKFSNFVEQNGIPRGVTVQTFVCPHWADVRPFAMTRTDAKQPYLDPGPPPLLGGPTDARFKAEFLEVARFSSQLDPASSETVDISLASTHNAPLGMRGGRGYPRNPATGQPYPPNRVRVADYGRVLAEHWADGPNSETPPGHWNVIANEVSDDPRTGKRVGGMGPVVDALEWDVKLYLALNGAVHDAAIGAWGVKGKYDSVRPISAIRYMGALGQSSDQLLPAYTAHGIPLVPGLVELITPASSAPGERHAHLGEHVGAVALRGWRGEPADHVNETGGVGWMLATSWAPYQRNNFVTPAFAGYTSGHSTFSRAAAEVLAKFTGSAFFPGGIHTHEVPAGHGLVVEQGPSQPVQLQSATYFDAADDAGLSRLYGGIHIASDDLNGRIMGSRIGLDAFARAVSLFGGEGRSC